jgi:hypothetical protein
LAISLCLTHKGSDRLGRYGAGQPTEALSNQIGNEPHVIPASAQHHAMLLSDRTAGLTAPVSHLKNSEIESRTIA